MKRRLPALCALAFFLALLFRAGPARQGAAYGLSLAFGAAVPALFPFFVASTLLAETGVLAALGRACAYPIWKLYGLPGEAAGALVLGLTGGYPVGARVAAELYRSGALTRGQAERLLGFCNNTGPAFIVGVCGAGVLGSARAGLVLYGVHIAAALLCGLVMTSPGRGPAPIPPRGRQTPRAPFADALVRACEQAAQTSLQVAAFITLFAVLAALAEDGGLLDALARLLSPLCARAGLPEDAAWPLLYGGLELTRGLSILPEAALPGRALLPAASVLLAFGGLSVWCQTMSVLSGSGLSPRRFFLGKILHAALAAALAALCAAALPQTVPALAPLEAVLPSIPAGRSAAGIVITLLTITYGKRRRAAL